MYANVFVCLCASICTYACFTCIFFMHVCIHEASVQNRVICVCVCMYVCTRTHTANIHTHTYTQTHTHTHMRTRTHNQMDKFAKLWPDSLSKSEALRDLDYKPDVTLGAMVASVLNAHDHSGCRLTDTQLTPITCTLANSTAATGMRHMSAS